VLGSCGQDDGPRDEATSGRQNDDLFTGRSRLDVHHLFPLKNLNIFERVAHHDVYQGLPGHSGEAGVVLHNGCRGDLPAQRALFDDGRFEAAPDGIDPGRESGGSPAHHHHVRLHLLGGAFGDEDGLGFELQQGEGEEFLGLQPLADEDIVGEGLGNAEGRILRGQFRIGLDVDHLDGNELWDQERGLDGVDGLFGAVGARGAYEDPNVPRRVDLLDDPAGLFVQVRLPVSHEDQSPHEGARLLSVRHSQIPDGHALGVEQQCRRGRHPPFPGRLMAQVEFPELDLAAQAPKGPDEVTGGIVQDIVFAAPGEEINGNVVWKGSEYGPELVFHFLAGQAFDAARLLLWAHRVLPPATQSFLLRTENAMAIPSPSFHLRLGPYGGRGRWGKRRLRHEAL